MENININGLSGFSFLKSGEHNQKLKNALRFLDGISRLPLENNHKRAEEIRRIYGKAQGGEKS